MSRFKFAIILVVLLLSSFRVWAGGDLGGGGVANPKPFELSPQEKAALQTQKDLEQAYLKWIEKIDQAREEKILRGVFMQHIVPQISSQPGNQLVITGQ